MLTNGIEPRIPTDMQNEPKGVYLFKSYEDMEDAVTNWLGDRYEDEDELVVLKINASGLTLKSTVDYEVMSPSKIPPENIIGYEDL